MATRETDRRGLNYRPWKSILEGTVGNKRKTSFRSTLHPYCTAAMVPISHAKDQEKKKVSGGGDKYRRSLCEQHCYHNKGIVLQTLGFPVEFLTISYIYYLTVDTFWH